jgi:two-component system sensor histidine kinase/response regulator
LAAIPGLDVAAGRRAVGDDDAGYRRVLDLFARAHGAASAVLRRRLAAGERDEIERLAGTLKRLSITLGASALGAAAERLEALARTGASVADLEAGIADLDAVLNPLLDGIRSLSTPPCISPDPNQSATPVVLARLQALLAEDDTRAADLVLVSAPLIDAALGIHAARFRTQVENFEFQEALATLRHVLDASND